MQPNPLRHAVSWAWMCRNGPLSLIGPPCLLSPYRYCVSTTRAFSVPGRREGGRGGGRSGGGKEGRKGEQMSVECGPCSRSSLTKTPGFRYFAVLPRGSCLFAGGQGVFGGARRPLSRPAMPARRECQHGLTVYKQRATRRQREPRSLQSAHSREKHSQAR